MIHTHSAQELVIYAGEMMRSLMKKTEKATIVTLSGELGAGKTTFVQGIAKALGVEEHVTSPTFVLEKVYALPQKPFDLAQGKWQRLIHVDAYRLKGAHELASLGWDEIIQDSGNLVVIEWPERIAAAIPKGATRIHFEIDGDGRIISIHDEEGHGA